MSNTKIARSPKCQLALRFLIQNQYHIKTLLANVEPKSTNTVEVHPRLFKHETALVRSMFQTPRGTDDDRVTQSKKQYQDDVWCLI